VQREVDYDEKMLEAKVIQRENAIEGLKDEKEIEIKALEHELEVRNTSVSQGLHIIGNFNI
jgi:hypothetical protein